MELIINSPLQLKRTDSILHCNGIPDGYRPGVVQSKPMVQSDFQFEADNGFSLKSHRWCFQL